MAINNIIEAREFLHKIGAFPLIFRLNQDNVLEVLLVWREDFDIWNLPGGGREKNKGHNEGHLEATIREAEEETGLLLQPLYTPFTAFFDPLQKDKPIGSENREDIASFTICKVVGGNLCSSEESKKIAWFPVNQLPVNLFEKHRWVIEKALKDDYQEAVESTQMHEVSVAELEITN